MRRISNRLLVRTALLFALLLIISQVIWIAVGSLIFVKPLRVGYVRQLATYVNLARSALASMPGDARSMFVKQVDAGRGTHLIEIKPVLDQVVLFVLEDRIAEKERLSEIEKEARAQGARELGRHWQDRLQLAGQCGITAVRIGERVARSERQFSEAAHRIRAAHEEMRVRRQRCRGRERRSIAGARVEHERHE